MKKILLFLSVFIFVLEANSFQKEIIVRTIKNIHTKKDVDNLVKNALKNHISWISIGCKQDEDDETASGKVFYLSNIAPTVKGYEKVDIFAYLIKTAHKNGIKVKAWIPQFHDQIAFKKDSSWRMMVYKDGKTTPLGGDEYFVNPMNKEVQNYELSIIKEIVKKYSFDAVVLDWIRFDAYNMDLSDTTREIYKKKYGYDPITIDFSKDNSKRRKWSDFKEDAIASYIKRVKNLLSAIKPNLPLGVYVLSPEWEDMGQDPEKFKSYIDFISPMAYYDDWEYPLDWIYGKRDDAILPLVRQKVGNKELIPVFDADWDKKIYAKIFKNSEKFKTMSFFEYNRWTPTLLKNIGSLK